MRFRAPIFVKLLGALVLPVVILFVLFAVVAYEVSRHDLDEELGRRLTAIAASAATQVRGKYLAEASPGDETARAYQNVQKKLELVSQATGARLFVLDKRFDARADTSKDAAIGMHYYRAELDRTELAQVFGAGASRSSVTFEGNDLVTYKTGYAPVRASETEPEIVLALGAQAPASYFSRLSDLRTRLFAGGAGLAAVSVLAAVLATFLITRTAAVSVLAAVLATFLITRNVRRLAAAAERIGAGDLHAPVSIKTRDELGLLGDTMDRMRIQLAERDAKMQQMLAGIAHEVRNPLAGMTLFAGILRDEIEPGDERRGHVDKIQRELDYLERVVNDFLEYARRPKPELATVEIDELFAEVIQLAPSELEVASQIDISIVSADRGQLRRALLNLTRNAIQAATTAGHTGAGNVRLAARKSGDTVELSVWNRGREISPETSGKLFEPFFTTREKGTGLGLAFVRDIAADHGGKVTVTSADGETTFVISLPG